MLLSNGKPRTTLKRRRMPQKAPKIPQQSPNYNMILPLQDPVFDKLAICKVDHSPFVYFLKMWKGL